MARYLLTSNKQASLVFDPTNINVSPSTEKCPLNTHTKNTFVATFNKNPSRSQTFTRGDKNRHRPPTPKLRRRRSSSRRRSRKDVAAAVANHSQMCQGAFAAAYISTRSRNKYILRFTQVSRIY